MRESQARMGIALAILLTAAAIGGRVDSVTLDVSPKVLDRSGEIITVEWSDLESPSPLDWIGIYTPPDSLDGNFIGYLLLSSSSAAWREDKGSLQLPLVNMRAAYQLRLFRGIPPSKSSRFDEDGNPLPSTDSRLAVSDDVQFASFNEPTQIHLSLTSNFGEVRVMFVTRDALECFILYGTEQDSLDLTVATKSITYQQGDMCDEPANTTLGWRNPGYIHDGVLGKLKPSKRYFYQVGSKEGGWSKTYSFVSSPEEGDETNALLFGDLGTTVPYKTFLWTQAQSASTLKWLERELDELEDKPTFISHIGDISYARGYAWLWDEFFHRIQPVAARAPYTVCIGNHEYDWPLQPWKPDWALRVYGTDGGGECGVPYSLKFQMPGNSTLLTGTKAPATKNLYFSLDFGVVHFLYFSTETDFLPGSRQYEFIVRDLEAVDRSKVPFVVVLGHRPMYTSNHEVRDGPVRSRMLEHLEPVLVKNRVDVVLWGHVHKYERTCAVKNFSCAAADGSSFAPVHVVIGMGGQDWQPQWEPRSDHPEYPIFPQPEWSVFRSEEFGYVRLHATKELLRLSYVGNGDGEVHDYVEIPASSSMLLSSSQQNAVRSIDRAGSGANYFFTASLWFAVGGFFAAAILLSVWKKRSDSKVEWKRLEMRPLEV
ncbi:probable inactive purple acid phosphatase 2 [Selaginella moellendorffii]|nr:probable inactive purple acid phosphatase 2 [Selaginella moellendorffii]|eukprot:XP_002987403.2 probable inactive purple acid phosphatase 2 [Selaginella moellendorffii]